jgi:hypothetical protein
VYRRRGAPRGPRERCQATAGRSPVRRFARTPWRRLAPPRAFRRTSGSGSVSGKDSDSASGSGRGRDRDSASDSGSVFSRDAFLEFRDGAGVGRRGQSRADRCVVAFGFGLPELSPFDFSLVAEIRFGALSPGVDF